MPSSAGRTWDWKGYFLSCVGGCIGTAFFLWYGVVEGAVTKEDFREDIAPIDAKISEHRELLKQIEEFVTAQRVLNAQVAAAITRLEADGKERDELVKKLPDDIVERIRANARRSSD
jgi:hypothetical protein